MAVMQDVRVGDGDVRGRCLLVGGLVCDMGRCRKPMGEALNVAIAKARVVASTDALRHWDARALA